MMHHLHFGVLKMVDNLIPILRTSQLDVLYMFEKKSILVWRMDDLKVPELCFRCRLYPAGANLPSARIVGGSIAESS